MRNSKIKRQTSTFTINHKGADGEDYNGVFTCQKQGIMDHSVINRRKSELSGGMYMVTDEHGNPTGQGIDEQAEAINNIIATLETVLIQAPDWWDLHLIDDYGLLSAVFQEVQKFEASFRKRGGEATEVERSVQSGEGAGSQERQAAKPTDNAPKVVDGKVSASLDA